MLASDLVLVLGTHASHCLFNQSRRPVVAKRPINKTTKTQAGTVGVQAGKTQLPVRRQTFYCLTWVTTTNAAYFFEKLGEFGRWTSPSCVRRAEVMDTKIAAPLRPRPSRTKTMKQHHVGSLPNELDSSATGSDAATAGEQAAQKKWQVDRASGVPAPVIRANMVSLRLAGKGRIKVAFFAQG
jgi:hypothetical protein